jgi:hypothetical protein
MYRSIPWESAISSIKPINIFLLATVMALLFSCGPKPPSEPTPAPSRGPLPIPFNLRAEAINGKAMLSWSVNRADDVPISGYNIYLADTQSVGDTLVWKSAAQKPYNGFPYPGDTDGDINSESFPIDGIIDGHFYMALVRSVGPGGTLSEPSGVITFEPVRKGKFTIIADHLSENGGFNFEQGISVSGRDSRNDIYLYATQDRVGLSSPSRLASGLRKSEFIPADDDAARLETIAITEHDIITVRTRRGVADITVEKITGRYPAVEAKISFVFRANKGQ